MEKMPWSNKLRTLLMISQAHKIGMHEARSIFFWQCFAWSFVKLKIIRIPKLTENSKITPNKSSIFAQASRCCAASRRCIGIYAPYHGDRSDWTIEMAVQLILVRADWSLLAAYDEFIILRKKWIRRIEFRLFFLSFFC